MYGEEYADTVYNIEIQFYSSGILLSKKDFDLEAANPSADLPTLSGYEILNFRYSGNVAGGQGCSMRVRFQTNGRHLEADGQRYKRKGADWWPCPEPDMSE